MLETLRQSLKTGIVTTSYPKVPAEVSSHARGRPEIDWANYKLASHPDYCHPSPYGYARIADFVAKVIGP